MKAWPIFLLLFACGSPAQQQSKEVKQQCCLFYDPLDPGSVLYAPLSDDSFIIQENDAGDCFYDSTLVDSGRITGIVRDCP